MSQIVDSESLSGERFPYQEDIAQLESIGLMDATPGADLNWLEDVELLVEEGMPAVFDRYSNSFLKIYFPIPEGREDELARKVLIKHLQSGNSYGIHLKEQHAQFAQPDLGPWVDGSQTVGTDYKPSVLEGWDAPAAQGSLPAARSNPDLSSHGRGLTLVMAGDDTGGVISPRRNGLKMRADGDGMHVG